MSNRLCYSCFGKIERTDSTCPHCGIKLIHDPEENEREEPTRDYKEEIKKIDAVKTIQQLQRYSIRSRQKDLMWMSLMMSVLGLLQIYTAHLIDSINVVSPIFGAPKLVGGLFLIISGFIYFVSIIGLYLNFKLMRIIILIANFIQMAILAIIYQRMAGILFRLTDTPEDLPIQVQNFLNNLKVLSYFILLFGLFYVTHSVFMYKNELLPLVYGRRR